MSSTPVRPIVIGIAGGSASGKTTLSQLLVKLLEGLCIEEVHMDRYFLKVKPKMVAPITRTVYEDHNHPDSFDLAQLVQDLDTRLTAEDAPQVIIVEGLMTLHDDAIRSRLDLRLFIDVQADERIVRRIKRNMAWGADLDQTATYVLDTVRYRHQQFVEPSRWHADLVLNGSCFSERGLELIVGWVRRRVAACAPDSSPTHLEQVG